MKKGNGNVFTFMFLGLILILFPQFLWSTQETKTFVFEKSRLTVERIDGYDWISYLNLDYNLKIGAPQLPVQIFHLSLPPGQEITGITVLCVISETLDGEYQLYPVQTPQISSNPTIRSIPPDPTIYTSAQPYPGSIVEIAHRGYLTGYSMGALLIHPVQYIPREKKLLSHTSIEVEMLLGLRTVSPCRNWSIQAATSLPSAALRTTMALPRTAHPAAKTPFRCV